MCYVADPILQYHYKNLIAIGQAIGLIICTSYANKYRIFVIAEYLAGVSEAISQWSGHYKKQEHELI